MAAVGLRSGTETRAPRPRRRRCHEVRAARPVVRCRPPGRRCEPLRPLSCAVSQQRARLGVVSSVRRSMSTSTGRAPVDDDFCGRREVHVGTITSSPGPTPRASSARWSAAVAEFSATAWRAPTASAKRSSNCFVRGPVVSQPESRTSRTAGFSRSVMEGRANGRNGCGAGSVKGSGPRRDCRTHRGQSIPVDGPGDAFSQRRARAHSPTPDGQRRCLRRSAEYPRDEGGPNVGSTSLPTLSTTASNS